MQKVFVKRVISGWLLVLAPLFSFGQKQLRLTPLDTAQLPKTIHWEGHIRSAVGWEDKRGKNMVLLTETGIYDSSKFRHENDGSDAELFAYHFLVKDQQAVQTWRVYDFISDCPVDIEAKFVKNTFQVTDLNNDGVAEIWLMYKTVCHGDVSPLGMKIIMYQGNQKFALRGQSEVLMGVDKNGVAHYEGGDYKFDRAFGQGPKAFLAFAEALWRANMRQELGE